MGLARGDQGARRRRCRDIGDDERHRDRPQPPSARRVTSDTEIVRNLHQPEGWRRDGIDFLVAPPPRYTDIASSSLRELYAVALATNVMVFLGRDTNPDYA
jgi:hypothetical protein